MTSLPFLYVGQLIDHAGEVIEEAMPVTVWPATGNRSDGAGEVFTHTGTAPLGLAAELAEANVRVVLGASAGPLEGTYRVVTATPQPIVPHVSLQLIAVKGAGN